MVSVPFVLCCLTRLGVNFLITENTRLYIRISCVTLAVGFILLLVVSLCLPDPLDVIEHAAYLNHWGVRQNLYDEVVPKSIIYTVLNLMSLDFFLGHFLQVVILPGAFVGFAGYSIERHKAARKDASNVG